jgi:hypothetical protein
MRIAREGAMSTLESLHEQGSPAVRRIVSAVGELERALDEATPNEQAFAVYVAVERLVDVYLRLAQLSGLFHPACERGEPPRAMFS